MDIFSHILWSNLILPGDFKAVTVGSIIPDLPNGPNWFYRLIKGKGEFWKDKKDLMGLVLGLDNYARGYRYVNRGFLYKLTLFLNSIFIILFFWGIAIFWKVPLFDKKFIFAYSLHILLDIFTHKGVEGWKPFYPFSKIEINLGIIRWGLEIRWYVLLNFILLGLLYFLRFNRQFIFRV